MGSFAISQKANVISENERVRRCRNEKKVGYERAVASVCQSITMRARRMAEKMASICSSVMIRGGESSKPHPGIAMQQIDSPPSKTAGRWGSHSAKVV